MVMTRERKGAVGRTSSGVLINMTSVSLIRPVDILGEMSATRPELVN